MTKYELLTAALVVAKETAKTVSVGDDGGSCNFDSLELSLPHFNAQKTLDAINDAGLHGYVVTHWGSRLFLVNSPVGRQGSSNTRQAEAMAKVMRDAGYDASVWYQVD